MPAETVIVLVGSFWQDHIYDAKTVGEFADRLADSTPDRTFTLKAGGSVLVRNTTKVPANVTLELIETREDGWQQSSAASQENVLESTAPSETLDSSSK